MTRIKQLLADRRMPLIAAVLAVGLTLPSLGSGLFLDDFFIRMVVSQPEGLPMGLPHALDTFCFMDGDQEVIKASIDYGSFPWWVNPDVRGCFWRPVTSITHFLDFRLWPERVWLMHLQSVLWYGALVLLAGIAFRRFMGVTPAAGLSALLFAVEDAHSIPAVWLANRNSVLACFFGLLALLLHLGWRKEGSAWKGAAAVAVFMISLLSAEAGIATMAYITAYALVLDEGPLKNRLLSLAPYFAVIVCWRLVWSGLGYGIYNIPLYADPLGAPAEFIRRLFTGLPMLITSQFVIHAAEALEAARQLWPWTWFITLAAALASSALFWPLIRTDRTARFFALGALFALVPACSTLPQSRNLMFVGIGALALMAMWLMSLWQTLSWPRAKKAVAVFLIAIHLVMAPLTLMAYSGIIRAGGKLFESFSLPEMGDLRGQDIIVVNHPAPFNMAYSLGERAMEGKELPARARVLSQVFTPISLTRTATNELRLRTSHGITGHFSRIVFTVSEETKAGREVRVDGMTAKVLATDERGIPTEALYTFDKDLEDASMRWLWWTEDSFRPFTLPPIGESVVIPGVWLPFGLKYKPID